MINSPLEDIEAAALQLAPAERAHLAERLLPPEGVALQEWLLQFERRVLLEALQRSDGVQAQLAGRRAGGKKKSV